MEKAVISHKDSRVGILLYTLLASKPCFIAYSPKETTHSKKTVKMTTNSLSAFLQSDDVIALHLRVGIVVTNGADIARVSDGL